MSMTFQWTAVDEAKQQHSGTMKAESREAVAAQLRKRRLFPEAILSPGEEVLTAAAPLVPDETPAGPAKDLRYWSFAEWFGVMIKAVPAAAIAITAIALPVAVVYLIATGKLS